MSKTQLWVPSGQNRWIFHNLCPISYDLFSSSKLTLTADYKNIFKWKTNKNFPFFTRNSIKLCIYSRIILFYDIDTYKYAAWHTTHNKWLWKFTTKKEKVVKIFNKSFFVFFSIFHANFNDNPFSHVPLPHTHPHSHLEFCINF
jgi:hypothetical protein